jgi:microcystin-dependent protein
MDPTLSEIRIFAGNYAPLSWALCQGQLMSIAENTALYSLLGTTYGGDGQTTFALPDFRGRVAVGTGQGGGLSPWDLGQVEGTENVTLLTVNMPMHNHTLVSPGSAPVTGTITASMNVSDVSTSPASDPQGQFIGPDASGTGTYAASATAGATLNSAAVSVNTNGLTANLGTGVTLAIAGGSQPISILQPYLGLNFIIAVEGIYPSRN